MGEPQTPSDLVETVPQDRGLLLASDTNRRQSLTFQCLEHAS